MDRVQFIIHREKRILLVDMSDTKPEEAIPILAEAAKVIQTQPPESLLTLTDVTNLRFDLPLANAFKEQALRDKLIVRAAAAVGVSGLMKIILDGMEKLSSRKFNLFNSREEALEWLVQQ